MGRYAELLNNEASKLENKDIFEQETVSEFDRISLVEWLNGIANNVNNIDGLAFDISIYNKVMYVSFNYKSITGMVKGSMEARGGLIETVDYIMTLITNCDGAIADLNKRLKKMKEDNGYILNIQYMPGFSQFASIGYWDYTNVVVKLSLESMRTISDFVLKDEIDSIFNDAMDGMEWSEYAPDFVEKFNSLRINHAINARFSNISLVDALRDNMLTQNDVKSILFSGMYDKGEQQIKSVYVLSALGTFIAILIWDIDYGAKRAKVDVLDNKVIDLENQRFVSDHSLYSRIEQKILSDANDIIKEYNEQ